MKLGELASRLSCELVGDSEIEISGLATIETAEKGQMTFLSNRKYRRYMATTRASAVITDDPGNLDHGQAGLISAHPYLTFAEAVYLFYAREPEPRSIHPQAIISPTASLGENVSIGAFTVIADRVKIGDNVTIHPHCYIYPDVEIGRDALIYSHCTIREGCRLGARVILQNNVVIGSDGFGYAPRPDKSWYKILQAGIVILEDEVEVGAGSVIDRATLGATIIGHGTKIDNLVQVGHGCTVGENTLLCAQVGLAGSTQVGDQVVLGGQVGAAGHLKIGDRVMATAQTGIPSSVESDRIISGYPAIDNRNWLKSSAVFAQLPELQKEIRKLKERLNRLDTAEET